MGSACSKQANEAITPRLQPETPAPVAAVPSAQVETKQQPTEGTTTEGVLSPPGDVPVQVASSVRPAPITSARELRPVFISFRVKEALNEARLIASKLHAVHGIRAFVSTDALAPGDDWRSCIGNALDGAMLVVVLATQTYGQEGSSTQGTMEELLIAKEDKTPLFVIKMCEGKFSEPRTRMELVNLQMQKWIPQQDQPLPETVWADLEKALHKNGILPLLGGPAQPPAVGTADQTPALAQPQPVRRKQNCRFCQQPGHNAQTCKTIEAVQYREQRDRKAADSAAAAEAAEQEEGNEPEVTQEAVIEPGPSSAPAPAAAKKQGQHCSLCGEPGHNRRTCMTEEGVRLRDEKKREKEAGAAS